MVSPLLTHWRYYSLTISYWYIVLQKIEIQPSILNDTIVIFKQEMVSPGGFLRISGYGNAFCITDLLWLVTCGSPHKWPIIESFDVSLMLAWASCCHHTVELLVIWDTITLMLHHCNVSVWLNWHKTDTIMWIGMLFVLWLAVSNFRFFLAKQFIIMLSLE